MPRKLRCVVTDILDHGEQVYSVLLLPETTAPRFLPGQFLHLALDEYTPSDYWPDSRVFTIASTPVDRRFLRITYAVKGQFTTRMETELFVGSAVWIKMPYGEFYIDKDRDVCLIAGGTGITAFSAFLEGLPADHHHHVNLFYGARKPDLLVYRSLAQSSAHRCPRLDVNYFAEQNSPGSDCLSGRLNLETIWNSLSKPLAITYFLAGPPEMIAALSSGLNQRGVAAKQIITDAWE